MEIEIPIDDELFERASHYAKAHGTTVEQLIRGFLEELAHEDSKKGGTQST